MTLHYDKHSEIKNKWQNQQISKHFKNRSNYRWKSNRYRHKIDSLDMADYKLSMDYNAIPVWDCPHCTYTNIERKSICNICNAPFSVTSASTTTSSNTITTSNTMTLGQFCKNVWDTLSIPVWICSQCTYCNIEQLPKCQMCFNPYHQSQQIEQNTETFSEIYEEHYSEDHFENDEYKNDEYKDDDTAMNNDTITTTQKSVKQLVNEDHVVDNKVKISVTIKVTPNKIYQKDKSRTLQEKNEDILRHTLLEAQLNIYRMDETLIKTYSCIPSIKNKDDTFTAYYDNILVPIKYKYRNHFGEFGYYPNNNPLKCIAQFMWKAQYPYLDGIGCPLWQFVYPENKNVRSPAQKQYILDSILPFLPLKDVINAILFEYLGYDELELIEMNTTFDHDIAYFEKYKIKNFEKDLFMTRNNGRLPFIISGNAYCTIKSRKINYGLKLTEIGYNYSGEAPMNNYWLSKKNTTRSGWYPAVWNKYVDILNKKYGTKQVRNRHDRKMKRHCSTKSRSYAADIKQFYPKKYLYLRKYGGGRRNRRKRRRSRYYVGAYQRRGDKSNPQYWKLKKDKRYTERKWSAYWKLNERNIS